MDMSTHLIVVLQDTLTSVIDTAEKKDDKKKKKGWEWGKCTDAGQKTDTQEGNTKDNTDVKVDETEDGHWKG